MQRGSWGSDRLWQCELRVPVNSSAEREKRITQITQKSQEEAEYSWLSQL